MGPQEDYIETVFTCEGDINDPNLQSRLEDIRKGLRDLLSTDKRKLILKKVEPWNSVRVTFNIPREAAQRLKQLAQQGDSTLRQLGVLAVQIEGDQIISLTIAGRNNERTRLVFRTESDTVDAPSVSVLDSGGGRTNDFETPGPSNAESTTQKNIADYLRQGAPLFDTLFGQQSSAPDGFQSPGSRDAMPFASMGMPSSATGKSPQPQQSFGFPPGKNPTSVQPHQSGFFPFDQQAKGSLGQPGMKLPSPPGLSPHSIPQQQGHELSLPPPPPYPHGSALVNNFVKGGRYPTTSTGSPLLVNLLQTEPSLAGINNFMHSKMLPPPETGSPPKKKRRQRKPKEKPNATVSETQSQSPSTPTAVPSSEGEVSIQSVPNPALATCGLPLVTSGSSSNMPSIPMVTQALPASTQPAVTYSGRQPIHPPHSPSHQNTDTNLHMVNSTAASNLIPLSQEPIPRKSDSGDQSQFLPENTAGKIINPYTGLLEPMENSSDTSPIKSDGSLDGFSPHKNPIKRSPKDKKQPPSGISPNKHLPINNVMHQGRMPPSSDRISSVPSSSAGHSSVNYSRQQHQQNETLTVYSSSSSSSNNLMLPSSSSLSSVSSMSSSPQPLAYPASRGNSGYVHSSPTRKESVTSLHNSNLTQNRTVNRSPGGPELMPVSSATQGFVTQSPTSSSPRSLPGYVPGMSSAELQPLHQSVYKSLTSGFPEDNHLTTVCCGARTTTSASPIMSHRQQQHVATNAVAASTQQKTSLENTSPSNSEQLLNPHVMNHPAKHTGVVGTSTNCLIDSPGGDSENSSQSSLLHEHSTPNDIAASGCTLEQETKVYNHDSGIGSSSERSDGTPSEPGDDFKAAHANSEDCGASIKHFLDGISKTTCVPKSDAQVITVGYAMSNSHVNKNTLKHNSDISSILSMPMEKALNHQTFNHVNCRKDKTKVMNHVGPSQQNTVLHWSTRDKIFSNLVESNKRKSPKQFLREECVAQVMTNKQKLPPYTADHLKHMQKMDPLMPPHGNCNSTFGGTDVHTTMSSFSHGMSNMGKNDEPRRAPFSTQQEVARSTVPSLKVNSHPANRCTSPRSSIITSEDAYRMCNNDYNSVQPITNNIVSRSTTGPSAASVASFSSSDTSQPNVSHYYQQKSFPRNPQVDKRTKSPLANNPISVASSQSDNVVSSTGMVGFGKAPEGVHSVSYSSCMSDVMSNGPVTSKMDMSRCIASSSGSYDPQKYSTSAASSNKRRSPANSMINSLPQHFFDPALPLAKRLTESVQKLVKPLPSIDQSSLPHAQHKSPGNTPSTKSQASSSPPRLTRTAPDARLAVPDTAMAAKFVKSNSPVDPDSAAPPHLSAEISSLMACKSQEDELVNNQDCLPISSHPFVKTDFQSLPSQESSVSLTGSSTHHTFTNCDSNLPVHSDPSSESLCVNPIEGKVHNISDGTNGGTTVELNAITESWTATIETQPNFMVNSASGMLSTYPHTTINSASVGGSVLQISTPSLKQKGTSHIDVTRSDCVLNYTTGGGIPPHTVCSTNTDNNTSTVDIEPKHNFEHDEQTGHSPSKVILNCNGNECNTSSTENSKKSSPNLLLNCSANNNLCTNTSQCPEITSSRAECVNSVSVGGVKPTCATTDIICQQRSGDSTISNIITQQNCEDMYGKTPDSLSQVQYTANSGAQSINRNEEKEESNAKEKTNNVPQLLPAYSESNLVNSTGDITDSTSNAITSRPQRQTSVPDSSRPLTPEDFSTTTMALRRSRKSSESNENKPIENKTTENLTSAQHNLRLTRQRNNPTDPAEREVGTRQRSNTADSQDKNADSDSGKNLRTSSRRRKPTQNEEISAADPSKKTTNLDDSEVAKHTRSSDTKDNVNATLKNDNVKMSTNEATDCLTSTLDSVKTGLRNRTQNKAPSGDEKPKGINKDLKKKPLVSEDELAQNKKAQLSRRSRHSPTLAIQNQIRDRSPVRSRTRTLVSPNTDPQEDSKRSTRSSKPRDATETLPPPNKRRRSSRDHR
ncbi:serine-rich adhesin for platelets-like [Pecten maximus]|uniref:serine-rich adhesin for platelets-like n=1 Tax=Pecten maximus TaxID=6579 RepID=UPI001457F59E|nr:serine-rich adhesin for platelets-like [Pecten maximus]